MKVGYFDCVAGASGDMLLGALLDAGASEDAVRSAIAALKLPEVEFKVERIERNGISALSVKVNTPHTPAHRHVPDLLAIVENAALPAAVKENALLIIKRIAESEGKVHGVSSDELHLHELGGDDTLVDIVGVLTAVDDLKLEKVYVSALPLGRGWTQSAHGALPLPAPAALALLENVPVYPVDIESELVTPTGAALLTTIASGFGDFPAMTLRKVGVGCGTRQLAIPNILRLWVGDSPALPDDVETERLWMIETNIDDFNPQGYDLVMERLFKSGALDVTITPIQMKKNRPAVQLSVLCSPGLADAITDILFADTPSLGLRKSTIERISLPRHFETVETAYGSIRVKVTTWKGVDRPVPEYEDCKKAALANDVSLAEVIMAVHTAYRSAQLSQ